MLLIDIFTCYAVAGVGSVVGLGLISLIQTDQPRVAHALNIYRWAFGALAMMSLIVLSTPVSAGLISKGVIGFAGMGVTLLAWAFRQLNGRRTVPLHGMAVTLAVGAVLWGAAFLPDQVYVRTLATMFCLVSVAMAIDQGWLIMHSPRGHFSEMGLMGMAFAFSLIWLAVLWHTVSTPGPYPAHWLHAPNWLLPMAGLGFALLPLSVAALAFSTINARLNQQLRARALSDELTGCLSRRGLRELGGRMLAMQEHHTSQVAVLMLDLDHFKAINDRYGHAIGDEVLRHVTHVVRDRLREDALLARYGGEEFSILLPVKHAQEAYGVAERLRKAVESTPCESKMGPIRSTVSIGVSFHCPTSTLEEDLSKADGRLYAAKQSGRNRVEVAVPDC
jgi:diguanylate cyclase (GGDEF)-like protein